jgi:type II pantothenate kinase
MGVILGIDIGTSATKVVGLQEDGTLLGVRRVRAEDQKTSLYGAMGSFLDDSGLLLGDVQQVALTGVGASWSEGDVFGIPTCRVEEFTASGAGGLSLAGERQGVVVTMGTGTAFLWAEQGKPVRHLCGSGIGGGTLGGLCRQMAGAERFHRIAQLAAGGDLKKVDLTVRDLARDTAATLDPDMTAANFGNLAEDVSPADLAAGAVNLVLQAIGTMTVLACRSCATDTAILTGSVTSLSQAAENFRLFERLYGLRCIIPEKATFATALGAALTAAKS